METTERIVEAYCRHIKGWLTLPNLRLGNYEVDLVAQDQQGTYYHIEVHVSVSASFSKLTSDPYTPKEEQYRGLAAKARNKIGFYVAKKFAGPEVARLFQSRGVDYSKVTKVIVAWGAQPEASREAERQSIDIWLMPDLIKEMLSHLKESKAYHGDDTMRTIQMVARTLALKGDSGNDASQAQLLQGVQANYSSLTDYLKLKTSPVMMSFDQIAKIMGASLPNSASRYSAWWRNDHPYSKAWSRIGWQASRVSIAKKQVTFCQSSSTVQRTENGVSTGP